MRRPGVGTLVTALALSWSIALAAPAAAHAELESSDPANGQLLETAPDHISLTFTEPPDVGLTTIRVVNVDRAPVVSAGDFAVYNFRVASDSALVNIEPPPGELVQAPRPAECGRLRPCGILIGERRKGGGGVQRRYSPVALQLLLLGGEASGGERVRQRPVLGEQLGGALRPDPARAREAVGRIAAERDEVGHLNGFDPVALPDLGRADAGELADAADRLEDRRHVARELLLTGRRMGADEAARWGLVNRVVAADALLDAARQLDGEVMAAAPLSVAAILDIGRRTAQSDPQEAMRSLKDLDSYRTAIDSADAEEGTRARAEGRSPNWQGR